MAGLAPYRSHDEPGALAYLARRPYDNAYVAWLLQTRQIGNRDDVVLWRDRDEAIAGFALVASRIVPCSDSSDALRAFAEHAKNRVRDPRLIVGAKPAVDTLWSFVREAMPAPFVVRRHQPIYVLEPGDLRDATQLSGVELATASEVDELAIESATMTSGEVGYRVNADAAFRRRTARIAEAGWLWRYRVEGKLAFMCHIGAETQYTAQLQGVWTPPAMRGAGHATRALGAICKRLLLKYPTISLSVNNYNAGAIALYERVGFRRAGALSTIIFT